MADGNSTVYPAAHFCNDLTIGGFSDWYMPAKNELEVCYFNLKPTTDANDSLSGINPNAVPARANNYGGASPASDPAQTSATDFKSTGAEDFPTFYFLTSTEASATTAKLQNFDNGAQTSFDKTGSYRVRAIRRVAV